MKEAAIAALLCLLFATVCLVFTWSLATVALKFENPIVFVTLYAVIVFFFAMATDITRRKK